MNKQFKRRILATVMLMTTLCSPVSNSFVLSSVHAAMNYSRYSVQDIHGLDHPFAVPEVRNQINQDLSGFVNTYASTADGGKYYYSGPYDGLKERYYNDNVVNDGMASNKDLWHKFGGQYDKFSHYNFLPVTAQGPFVSQIRSENEWRKVISQMENSCSLFLVPDTELDDNNHVADDATVLIRRIPLLDLKTAAFAIYLHHIAESNPGMSPKEIFLNTMVKDRLNLYWGNILWFEKSGGSGVANAITGTLGALGLGNALNEFMPNMSVKKASEVALSVYYDSANWYQKVKYKVGRWGAFGIKSTAVASFPIAAWKFSGWVANQIGNIVNGTSRFAKDEFLAERNKLLNNPVKLRIAVKKMMQDGVVGLTYIIDPLTTLVTGNVALRKSEGLVNKNCCQLIAFVGPPGMGKSLLAQKYAVALTGKPIPSWGYITSASIKPGVSPVDQFFDVNSNLIKNLKRCKGNTVIFIDEIDKFDSNDLLESFRDAVDRGTIVAMSKTSEQKMGIRGQSTSEVINTESIDVSGLIVIVGTNERPECWGLEPDPDEPAYNVGRTVVERSGSMVQRFQRFKFNPYTVDEYKQMYDNALKSIRDESPKMFGLQVEFDDDLSEDLARESEHRLMGGRSVPIVLSELAGAVTSYDIDAGEQSTTSRFGLNFFKKFSKSSPKKLKVSFNPSTHRFMIRQIDTSLPQ